MMSIKGHKGDNPRTDPLLLRLIDETDSSVFEKTVDLLCGIGDIRAAYPLQTLAKRCKTVFAKHAARAISNLLQERFAPMWDYEYQEGKGLVRKRYYGDDIQRTQISAIIQNAVVTRDFAQLSHYIQQYDWYACEIAVYMVAQSKLADPLLIEPLLGCLLLPEVCLHAAVAIKSYRDPRAIPSLIWLLKYHEGYSSRSEIAKEVLPAIGRPAVSSIASAIRQLKSYLGQLDSVPAGYGWRSNAVELQSRGIGPAIAQVSKALQGLSVALENISDPSAKGDLEQLANDPIKEICESAQKALSRL